MLGPCHRYRRKIQGEKRVLWLLVSNAAGKSRRDKIDLRNLSIVRSSEETVDNF